jgi:competence protein ComEC
LLILGAAASGWTAYSTAQREIGNAVAATSDWPASVEVRVLDVGQGNAVVVRTPDHHALLFDGGPAGCNLGKQLHSLGITRLDAVVISHPHADHFAGLLECLGTVDVDTVIDGVEVVASGEEGEVNRMSGSVTSAMVQGGAEARAYLRLRHELEDRACTHVLAHQDMRLAVGDLKVRLFTPEHSLQLVDGPNPWARVSGPPGGDELNAASIVAVVSWGESDVLIPGDAEADVLERYPLPPVEALVVSHHGSKGAVSPRLLERLAPRVAAVSVGAGNSFGHPDPSTLDLLRSSLGMVLRTDESGWVSFLMTDTTMSVTAERRAGS